METKAASLDGCHYYVSFIDDHTRKVWVYFMKHKSEVFSQFKAFKAMVEKENGMQIKVLRSDGGVLMQIYPSAEWGCRKKE